MSFEKDTGPIGLPVAIHAFNGHLGDVPGVDSDRDGIADAWERFYAQNLTTMTAVTDSDGDGVTDPDEYAADTNPLLRSDALRITHFVPPRQLVPLGPFLTDLAWTSKPTRWYSIEAKTDLPGPWKPQVENLLPAAGGASLVSFPDSVVLQRYYRVRAKLPLAP